MKILFVCLANWRRSRTAMEFFRAKFPEIEFDSCGVVEMFVESTKKQFPDAKVCTQELINEADVTIAMDSVVYGWLEQNFQVPATRLRRWYVEDIYDYNSDELKDVLLQCLWL